MAGSAQHPMAGRRVGLSVVFVVGSLLGSTFTRAVDAKEPFWSAPSPCPDAAVVTSKVQELLRGYDYAPEQLARFSGRITRREGAEPVWVLRLSLGEGAGEKQRVMEASRCEDLGDAAALAMALAIHPELELSEPAATSTGSATPAPSKAPAPVAATAPQQASSAGVEPPAQPGVAPLQGASPQQPVSPVAPVVAFPVIQQAPPPIVDRPPERGPGAETGEVGVSAVAALSVDAGALPEAAAGFFGAAVLSWASQRFELGGGLTPRTATSRKLDGSRARFSLYRGKLSVCHNPFAEGTGLFGCVSAEGGALWARGQGVDEPNTQTVPWFAPGAGLLALGKVGPQLSLDVRGDVLFPLTNDRFEVDGKLVHEIPRVAFGGRVGVDFRFR